MRRTIFTIGTICCVTFFLIGADIKPEREVVVPKKHCSGYTIIEAGKGIDCYGDTVKLVKKYGFYELASQYKN